MAYDADGNRISRVVSGGPDNGTDTYSYDFENRLISTVNGTTAGATGAYAYQYDYRTRRISRNESGASGVTTAIVFSGGTSVQEYDNAATVPTVEYVRGSDYGGGVGGILYTLRGGVPSYTHENRRGDVVAKTDDTGSLTFQAQYNASGKVIADNGATLDRQKSNSKDCDPWGGINDGQRYSVIRGKIRIFLTRDPAGMIDGPNEYTYVNQNPWTKFDPEGLEAQDQSLDDTRKKGVTIDNVQRTTFKPGEAEGVLAEHGEHVTKPGEISDDRVKELRESGQYDGKSDQDIRVSESARENHVNARWALLKYERTPGTQKLFEAWSGMNDILTTTTMALPGPSGAGAAVDVTGAASKGMVTAYRVEGVANERIIVTETGDVIIQGDKMLYMNFGDKARAMEFLQKRLGQGMEGVTMKSFDVPASYVEGLQRTAVPQSVSRQYPGMPQIADPSKAANQYGLPASQIPKLQQAAVPGSGATQ